MCIDLKLDDVPTHPKKACMESWRLLRFFGENLGVWNDSGMCSWWIGMISLRKIAHHHKLGSCNPYKWSEINGFHWGQTNPTYRGPITPFIMIGSGLTSCMSRWGIEDLPRRQDVCKTNARTAKARVFWCEVGDRWNDMDTCWSYARLYLWYIIYTYIYICIFTCMLATCIFILVVFCLEFVEFFQCHELLLASWTRKLFLTFKSRWHVAVPSTFDPKVNSWEPNKIIQLKRKIIF